VEARAAREERERASAFSWVQLAGAIAVLAGVAYLGLAWGRSRSEPLPVRSVASPAPPSSPARTDPPRLGGAHASVSARTPPQWVPADAKTDAVVLAPSAPPVVDKPTTPSPSPSPERSEVDTAREGGERKLEDALSRLVPEKSRLIANARTFDTACLGTQGEPRSCARLFDTISASAQSLVRDVQAAEEEARRSWVSPGRVRDLRERNGLDDAALDDVTEAVSRLEARYRGKP
jgi:hypothetical protein